MAQNVMNRKNTPPPVKQESWLMGWLGSMFGVEKYIGKDFPVEYLDKAVFLLFVGLFMVGFRLNAERQVRQIRSLREQVNQKKAEYVIQKSIYMSNVKQSELAPKVAPLGIVESRQAPHKIVVPTSED